MTSEDSYGLLYGAFVSFLITPETFLLKEHPRHSTKHINLSSNKERQTDFGTLIEWIMTECSLKIYIFFILLFWLPF